VQLKNALVVANGLFLWLATRPINLFFDIFVGAGRRPVFFDIAATRPDLLAFDRHYPAIREEVERLLESRVRIPRYHEIDPLQRQVSEKTDPHRSWSIFMLNSMDVRWEENRARCPVTSGLVDQMPDLFQAFFSILEGGKSIPAHNGIYRGYLRYHLALKVPRENPPKIRVKDQFHQWKEGESVLFDDSWEHQVYNEASDFRVVLIVDILRPMPALPSALNRVVKAYLRLHYVRWTMRKPIFH
jgi:aspartyl/asparaginyl beta-hydroxylase (cupin superfamily)